jgi:hypothetical protein
VQRKDREPIWITPDRERERPTIRRLERPQRLAHYSSISSKARARSSDKDTRAYEQLRTGAGSRDEALPTQRWRASCHAPGLFWPIDPSYSGGGEPRVCEGRRASETSPEWDDAAGPDRSDTLVADGSDDRAGQAR